MPELATCPYPPQVHVADEFIAHLDRQLYSVRYRYTRDPLFPGWTMNEPNHTKRRQPLVFRYDDEHGNFWLYVLTDELSDKQPYGSRYRIAKWMD